VLSYLTIDKIHKLYVIGESRIKNLNSYLFKENEKKIKNPVQNSGPWGPNSDWDTKKNYIL